MITTITERRSFCHWKYNIRLFRRFVDIILKKSLFRNKYNRRKAPAVSPIDIICNLREV